ncbi:MAG: GNAT family N-acetyltransferase [Leptolyngbyaceae cyanobacterium MO_188.B28]|nr:GNAT family N-acetyltransferase [Leptolyngbyaceae cyanobacterium MO_188.B28]
MITISEAHLSDVSAIKNVLSVTWQDTYRSFLSDSAIESVTSHWHAPQVLENEIERDSTFVGIARSGKDVVAMITAHENEDLIFVSRLYVLPSFQRRGIGITLLSASYSAFPMAKRVKLEVEEQNLVGLAFYRKLGFAEVDRTEDDVFGILLHSIVMEREIERNAA